MHFMPTPGPDIVLQSSELSAKKKFFFSEMEIRRVRTFPPKNSLFSFLVQAQQPMICEADLGRIAVVYDRGGNQFEFRNDVRDETIHIVVTIDGTWEHPK